MIDKEELKKRYRLMMRDASVEYVRNLKKGFKFKWMLDSAIQYREWSK